MIRARTEPELQKDVDLILQKIGLNQSEAINIFFKQIKLHNGIPFELKIPNKITRKTFRDTDQGKNINRCKNKEDMFKKLDL